MKSRSRDNTSKEIVSQELLFEKICRFLRIRPILFGAIIFGTWQLGNELINYLTTKSFEPWRIPNALSWWGAYTCVVVSLLHLRKKYVGTIGAIDLPTREQHRLISSFPSKRLRVVLIITWTAFFMVLQIIIYTFILRVPFHFASPLAFIFWEASLPLAGVVAGEWSAEAIEIGILPWRIRDRVKINVLHHDHHGGLKKVSELFTHLIIGLTVPVSLFSVSAITSAMIGLRKEIMLLWLMSYAILGALGIISAFVVPQLLLSKRMKESRSRELAKYYQSLVPIETSGNHKNELTRLRNFIVYQEIQKMKDHPFSMGQLESVIALSVIPAMEIAIPLLLSHS